LFTIFRAPGSYTGEDVVEIACHGGILLTARILQILLRAGARSAAPGEFTRRAFLNGKMDLTQAEAVMDTIRAQSDIALRAATAQREGHLARTIEKMREDLMATLAHLEAYIDFPEEGIEPATQKQLLQQMQGVATKAQSLLETAKDGRILREGVHTAICGIPNAGKSSLLNQLLGWERAIVHDQPGTTRDTIEETAILGGLPFRLIDTAGLRSTEDPVEKEGVTRAEKVIAQSDLVLHVVDVQTWSPPFSPVRPDEILVLNKCDTLSHPLEDLPPNAICISCATGDGIADLINRLTTLFQPGAAMRAESGVAINARHLECLRKATTSLDAAMRTLKEELPPEITAIELRSSIEAIGEIAGFVDA